MHRTRVSLPPRSRPHVGRGGVLQEAAQAELDSSDSMEAQAKLRAALDALYAAEKEAAGKVVDEVDLRRWMRVLSMTRCLFQHTRKVPSPERTRRPRPVP